MGLGEHLSYKVAVTLQQSRLKGYHHILRGIEETEKIPKTRKLHSFPSTRDHKEASVLFCVDSRATVENLYVY